MKSRLYFGLIFMLSVSIMTIYTSCDDLLKWLLEEGAEIDDPNNGNKNSNNSQVIDEFNDDPIIHPDILYTYNFNDNIFNGWESKGTGSAAITTASAEVPGNYNFGNNTRFVKLPAPRVSGGGTITFERNVNLQQDSVITFSFKTEIYQPFGQNFKLYVNKVEMGSWNGVDSNWKKTSIPLMAGVQNICFELSTKGTSVKDGLNAVYIDNIVIVKDIVSYVELYPRGKLNTYVGAPEKEKIKFSAKAFRADKSVRENTANPVFSGTGINSSTGVLTPSAEGNMTVSVSVGGIQASNSTITVHPADYLRKPYTYPGTGITYNGFAGTEGVNKAGTSVTITYPSETTFNADGFFTLEGNVSNASVYNYALVRVRKGSDATLDTTYLVRDNFKQRIWLRFGPGVYTVTVYNLLNIELSSGLKAEGDYYGSTMSGSLVFTVTNTRNEGAGKDAVTPDKRFIYPSYLVQSDDFRVTNLMSEITYGLTNDRAKVKAINDYLVMNTVYDQISYRVDGMRKKQDALTVLGTRYNLDKQYPNGHFLAVCEGYANTGSALMRAAGIEVKYIVSEGMSHAWNEVYIDGGWKFLDITWNDPSVEGSSAANVVDKGPASVSYEYFLLTSAPSSHTAKGIGVPSFGRSVESVKAPWLRGAPEGWY